MTLRKKTLIIIGATIVGLIAILYVVSGNILMGGFKDLEQQDTIKNTERAIAALNDDLSALDTLLFDWAAWDDTYEFVQDASEDYIESNLVDETFISYPLNVILFLDSDGKTVFGKALDLEEEEEIPVPPGLEQHLSAGSVLVQHADVESNTVGIVLLDDGPLMIASRPIITSLEEGPIRGTMIMARYLDSAEIEELAGLTQLSLAIHEFNDSQIPGDFEVARSSLSEEAPTLVQKLSDESIAGYALIEDVHGDPALILGAEMPRGIYEQGQASSRYLVASLVAAGLVFLGLTIFLLEKLVLSRLARLSESVRNIGTSGDISARVPVTGRDELSNLGVTINSTLVALEQSQEEVRRSEQKNRAILETIPDSIFQVSRDGTILNYKPPRDDGLESPPAEVFGKNIREVMPAEVAQQALDHTEQAIQTGDVQVFEYPLLHKGQMRNYEARMITSGEDEVLSIMRDITDQKQAEETRRKEVLLKETHHRVNNNLQVIASLLKLQANYVKDDAVVDMFRESQDRVKSMAIIHEKLYQSGGITGQINFAEYVRDLANHLLRSYGVDQDAIKLQSNVPDVLLDLDMAIPCGQIVNELISNSLKHAFPAGKEGVIRIDLGSDVDNRYTLSISDNGVGLPEDVDLQNVKSLGLELVITLAGQLGGTIDLDRSGGTAFRITFTEPTGNGGR